MVEDGLDHDLWIVGDGEERSLLEAYIHENHLEASAKLLGFRENPYNLMYAADILVCSSIFEGFSTFVTEGLILGKPIITTDVSGMHELLGDSEYGLITANDDEAFYEGVKRMLTSQSCWSTMRSKLRFVVETSNVRNWRRIRKRFLRENYRRNGESKWA